MTTDITASHVLVVDDQPINVQMLARKLQFAGIRVSTAFDGPEALAKVKEDAPDLILLDVMMPGMDGIEVCTRLKSDERTVNIPVIFITAKDAKESKLQGLELGAVDYITKPIDLDETLARVKTQLDMARMHKKMLEFQEYEAYRLRQASVMRLTQGLAHNVNNHLGVAVGYLDLLKSQLQDAALSLTTAEKLYVALDNIGVLVKQLRVLEDYSKPQLSLTSIPEVIKEVIAKVKAKFPNHNLNFVDDSIHLSIETDQEKLALALEAGVTNACESYDEAGQVNILVLKTKDRVHIIVEDTGRGLGINAEQAFDPLVTTKGIVGAGFGLPLARHALGAIGGSVRLEANNPVGTAYTISLPVKA